MTRTRLGRHFPTLTGLGPGLRAFRLPRPRHKARWAAALILVAACAAGWPAARRHLDAAALARRRRAEGCVKRALDARQEADALTARLADPAGQADDGGVYDAMVKARRRQSYYRTLSIKYYAAANRPWRPVAPDPPEPK
jgi:hypothetical protein